MKFQPRTRMFRRAFSLIELLVVIGIIALLLGILIPTISRARDSARRVTCMSNMRQLTVAWTEYATNHDGNLVGANNASPGDWVVGGNSVAEIKAGLLFPYCPQVSLYHCPADYSDHFRSFSMNAYFNGEALSGHTPITRLDQTRFPGQTFVFVEEFDLRGDNLNSFLSPVSGDSWIDVPAHFHGNGCTLGFADDHAEFWVYADARTALLTGSNQTTPNNPDLYRFEKAVGY